MIYFRNSQASNIHSKGAKLTLLLLLCLSLCVSCKPSPHLLWKFKTGDEIKSSPVIFGKQVLFNSNDSFLYSLDQETGKEVWKTKVGSLVFCSPIVQENTVYFGTDSGNFIALDASTGKQLWSVPTGAFIEYTPCTDGEAFYVGNNAGRFYKVSPRGEVLWNIRLPMKVSGSCKAYQGLVYTSCWDRNFYALRGSTGEVAWKKASGTLNFSGPAIHENTIYFVSHEHIYAFDPSTGNLKFTKETPYCNRIFVRNGSLWTADETRLVKRDFQGNQLDEAVIEDHAGSPFIDSDRIIIGDRKRRLYGLSSQLDVLWKFKGGDMFAGPGVVNNGILFIGNSDGNLYAIRLPH